MMNKSQQYDTNIILKDEEDQNSFFIFVQQCLEQEIKKQELQKRKCKNMGIFILSNTVQQPYIHSFLKSLERTQYRGMGSSKMFRCTPVNAMASYLSIVFGTNGPALTFVKSTGEEKEAVVEYIEALLCDQNIETAVLLELDLDYLDTGITNEKMNRAYRVNLNIETFQ